MRVFLCFIILLGVGNSKLPIIKTIIINIAINIKILINGFINVLAKLRLVFR